MVPLVLPVCLTARKGRGQASALENSKQMDYLGMIFYFTVLLWLKNVLVERCYPTIWVQKLIILKPKCIINLFCWLQRQPYHQVVYHSLSDVNLTFNSRQSSVHITTILCQYFFLVLFPRPYCNRMTEGNPSDTPLEKKKRKRNSFGLGKLKPEGRWANWCHARRGNTNSNILNVCEI